MQVNPNETKQRDDIRPCRMLIENDGHSPDSCSQIQAPTGHPPLEAAPSLEDKFPPEKGVALPPPALVIEAIPQPSDA